MSENNAQNADYNANFTALIIPPHLDGARLDKALAALLPDGSRAAAKAMIVCGAVFVDGVVCQTPRFAVASGASVRANLAAGKPAAAAEVKAQDIALDVVYEDDDLIVINKPPGMVVHPAPGHAERTLQNALLYRNPSAAGLARGGVVHRLDKDTGGLIAAAKSEKARRNLIRQFKAQTIKREYLALVFGTPPQTGLIDKPLLAPRAKRPRAAVARRGREAQTSFIVCERKRLLEKKTPFALLRCRLRTGRTHQIRAHLEAAGYPIVGDKIYRRRALPLPAPLSSLISRQLLHAAELRLRHPISGEVKQWQSPLPPDFQRALQTLDELSV
jgi:23S rRNA pseudouridine1911/1915/1917 synthase